jgi:hypothetical protein
MVLFSDSIDIVRGICRKGRRKALASFHKNGQGVQELQELQELQTSVILATLKKVQRFKYCL